MTRSTPTRSTLTRSAPCSPHRALALLGFVLVLSACGIVNGNESDAVSSQVYADDSADVAANADTAVAAQEAPVSSVMPASDDGMFAADGEDMTAETTAGGGGNLAVHEISPINLGRQIIYTAEIEVRVTDVMQATAEANRVVAALGGLLFGQRTEGGPRPTTVLTYRVYPEDFDRAMAALEGVGEVERQSISTDDVTERIVDIESRITTATLSVERVRELIVEAADVEGIVALEQQLLERETLLEQLKGRLRTLQDQVNLATITLTITEIREDVPDAAMDVVAWLGENADSACPGVSDLTIEANDEAVLCIEVQNTGDDTLTGVDVDVPTLRLRIDDLTVRSGDLDALEAGESVFAVVTLESRDGFVRRISARNAREVEVVATAVPAASLRPTNEEVTLEAYSYVYLEASVEDPLPGFTDSFSSGWSALGTLGSVLLVAFGTVLPFVPFVALAAWLILRRFRKRNSEAGPLEDAGPDDTNPDPADTGE